MPIKTDTQRALELLEQIQEKLRVTGDEGVDDDLRMLISLLENPVFSNILTIQESIRELKWQVQVTPSLLSDDFDIAPSGELILTLPEAYRYAHMKTDSYDPEQHYEFDNAHINAQRHDSQTETTPRSVPSTSQHSYSLSPSTLYGAYNLDFQNSIEAAAQGREILTIQLYKPEGSSLGFSVVGLKSEEKGELGIFVQDIQSSGIASRDGRLQESDQILAIDGQVLDTNISHQQAIGILQQARGLVELVVARGGIPRLDHSPSTSVDRSPLAVSESSQNSNMVLNTEWAQVEVIDLINDGSGLGFGIVGGRSTGVVVKTILPGGVADRNGRLQSGDHILQIGEVNLRGMGSEQVAAVLRQSGSQVRLIVARAIEPSSPDYQNSKESAPIVPTRMLNDQEALERHLGILPDQIPTDGAETNGYDNAFNYDHLVFQGENAEEPLVELHHPPEMLSDGQQPAISSAHTSPASSTPSIALASLPLSTLTSPVSVLTPPLPSPSSFDPEVEEFDVDLIKDVSGLGITIAGYVGENEEISGIFVKSIAEGSAADVDGRLQVNDQIVEVDGQSLQGFTNLQAVEVLRNTGRLVRLRIARYLRGPKFKQLQQCIANSIESPQVVPTTKAQVHEIDMTPIQRDDTLEMDGYLLPIDEDYSCEITPEKEAAIKLRWQNLVGKEFDIVIAQLSKFREGGGLGISLEGTVDVEDGKEVRPHHYIRSILNDGPVGINGRLHSGDELLAVNGQKLLGLNHIEVVSILKELPLHVRMVCARRKTADFFSRRENNTGPMLQNAHGGSLQNLIPMTDRLVKAKSDGSLAVSPSSVMETSFTRMKSRSLEPLTGLAMWSNEPQVIELVKGDRGLGFSILDYQDPMNPTETVIVIRSLVPGGVAQQDGRLIPGDRLLYVNDINLENASLETAVQALKGAPKGIVRIGVAKPLPLPDSVHSMQSPANDFLPEIPEKTPIRSQVLLQEEKPPSPEIGFRDSKIDQFQLSKHVQMIKTSWTPLIEGVSPSQTASTLTSSDLTTSGSLGSTPLASPHLSPMASPSLSSRFLWGGDIPPLPTALERTIKVKKSAERIGINVDAINKGVNGCIVRSITPDGTFAKDGRIQVGDFITSVNNESFRKVVNAQARTILRRASLGSDISIKYIPAADAAVHRESALLAIQQGSYKEPETFVSQTSPRIFPKYYRSPYINPERQDDEVPSPGMSLQGVSPPSVTATRTTSITSTAVTETVQISPTGSVPSIAHTPSMSSITTITSSTLTPSTSPLLSAKPKPVGGATDGASAAGAKYWGPPRVVELEREPTKSLGISIVGGKVDLFNIASEASISGIFIKHVLSDSPAGRNGTLKTGDRILEVDGVDLRDATHEKAVEVIRNATSPVRFLVQSLCTSCPRDTEGDKHSVSSEDESRLISVSPIMATTPPKTEQSALTTSQEKLPKSDRLLKQRPSRTPISDEEPLVQVTKVTTETGVEVDSESAAASQVEDDEEVDSFGYTWKKVQTKYGELRGELQMVELAKSNNGLGLSLAGNKDRNKMSVFVVGVHPDGAAAKDGRIRVGDELLEINGVVLYGRSHLNASAMIKGLTSPLVKIILLRREDALEEMAVRPIAYYATSLPGGVQATSRASPKHGSDTPPSGPPPSPPSSPPPSRTPSPPHTPPSFPEIESLHPPIIPPSSDEKGDTLVETSVLSKISRELTPPPELPSRNQDSNKNRKNMAPPPPIPPKPKELEKPALLSKVEKSPDSCVTPGEKKPVDLSIYKHVKPITLIKGPTGFGFTIMEGNLEKVNGIFFKTITPGGVAAQDGRLKVGDQLLLVNGESILGMQYGQVVHMLKRIEGKVTFTVNSTDTGAIPIIPMEQESLQPSSTLVVTTTTTQTERKEESVDVQTTPPLPCSLPRYNSPPKNPASCLIRPGRETTIEIQKGKTGLGLSIVGGSDTLLGSIIVHEVYPDGAAARDGRLQAGDQIIAVNGEDLRDATHDRAITALRQTPSKVKMVVFRDDVQYKDEDIYDIFEVELMKKHGKGLGLSIVGRRNDTGVFISDVVKGGVAEADGRLMQGDQILIVNGEDLKNATQEQAAAILKTTMGKVLLTIGRLKGGSRTSSRRASSSASSHSDKPHVKKSESNASSHKGKHGKESSSDSTASLKTVYLNRSTSESLGFTISSKGSAHIITSLQSDIPKLRIGDRILSVNGQSVEGMSQAQLTNLLKQASGQVTLQVVVGDEPESSTVHTNGDTAGSQYKTITLDRGPDGLGFSVVGGYGSPHGNLPIYIKTVFVKGAAAEDGQLKRGDQIIAVNGESLEGATHETAVQILKNAKGSVILTILP